MFTDDREWFKPWRTIAGEALAPDTMPQLQVMIEGLFEKRRFLDLVRDFIVFEDDGGRIVKKMAGCHQFHAVRVAVAETLRAAELARADRVADAGGRYEAGHKPGGQPGDRRIGVVWHTQGSGKSLTMAFYAGRIIREPAMENPTLVVLTNRNDLDDQLFATFARCQELLRQPPVQAESRAHLRELLSVTAGGVVFTTIQKFLPEEKGDRHPTLSERHNIVVIADEAHRSQYDFIAGFARHMRDALPNASFIGFTGTPIEKADANTRAVFGDYISIYDIQRAVQDGATVPIYYESRLARLDLPEELKPKIDEEFEEVTEGEEIERKERLKSKWAQIEAIVGAEKRLRLIAQDIVEHFEQRLEALEGKAMVVGMSRRICVELYREIVKLRPQWASEEDDQGEIKIVMTGSASDPPDWQPHIRNKPRREALAKRFRDPNDPFKIVIVRDMWLTGFDCPSLHTLYLDKPMRGHGLMQAIARVNRVFRDKPGGLVVDYLGLAHELKQALATYTESGGTGQSTLEQERAVALMQEKYEICCGILHGFDWSDWVSGDAQARIGLLPAAQEQVLSRMNGKERFLQAVRDLSKAFALAAPHEKDLEIRDDVAFFQAVDAALTKRAPGEARPEEDLDHADVHLLRAIAIARGRSPPRGGSRPRHPPDRLARHRPGGRGGSLRSGRSQEARHFDPLRRIPGRGARDAAEKPGRGAPPQTPRGRDQDPPAQECGPGPFVRRTPRAGDPPLPEPGSRGNAGDRGSDQARRGHARGERTRREAEPERGGAGLLRRAGDQRQRRQGPGRRDAPHHCPRTGGDRAQQRDH